MLAEVLEITRETGEIQQTGSEQPPLMALAASVVSSGTSAPNDEATTPKVPGSEEEAVSALELIFTKVAPAESSMATVDAETAEMVEGKKEQTLESILQILPPWEQHMLALLYEQQEMRRALGQLRDHFVQRLKEIQISVKKGLLEKLELTEHCDRMLAALWSFKAELTDSKSPNRVDEDTNAKFAKLMAKLEELSIRLAERDIDYKLLSEDYLAIKQENATLQETTRRLKEENNSLLMIPKTMTNWEELKGYDDVEKKALARDVQMLQGYASHLRMRLEEGRAVELDVRRLNQALYVELLAANTAIADLQDQVKFYTSVDRREATLLEEQLAAANQAEAEKSDRIRDLEEEVASLKAQLAAALSKPEPEEPEVESPAEAVEGPAETEQQPPTRRSVKKSSLTANAKAKPKATSRAPTMALSHAAAVSPAKQKPLAKRSTAATASVERGSIKRVTRAPSRASIPKPEKPTSAKGGEGSRLVRVVEPEGHSSPSPSPKAASSLKPPTSPKKRVSISLPEDDPSPSSDGNRPSAEAQMNVTGRAPAFTGDPRNKGLANMVAALSGRRRKGGGV